MPVYMKHVPDRLMKTGIFFAVTKNKHLAFGHAG